MLQEEENEKVSTIRVKPVNSQGINDSKMLHWKRARNL